MKPQELRIGNFVLLNNEVMGVKSIKYSNKRDIYWIELDFTNGYKVPIDEIKGVPLDDWWLIKFGFQQGKEEHEDEWVVDIDSSAKLMLHKDDFSVMFVEHNDWVSFNTCIKYVHQLQNLLYCLCGESFGVKKGIRETQTPPSDT